MIRRHDDTDWLLISQLDHARIAAEVAAQWFKPDWHASAEHMRAKLRIAALNPQALLLPLQTLEESLLIPPIRDHDDGWWVWEFTPRIDPATGKPRNFTEMPMADSTAIWTRSIDRCLQHSRLGALWVSKHFCRLAEFAHENRADNPADIAAADAFLGQQSARQNQWRAELDERWEKAPHLDDYIDFGYRCVRFFDALSLRLCCAAQTEPGELTFLDRTYCLVPQSPARVVLTPWPFQVRELTVSSPARRLPASYYPTDDHLQTALKSAPIETLWWTLVAV